MSNKFGNFGVRLVEDFGGEKRVIKFYRFVSVNRFRNVEEKTIGITCYRLSNFHDLFSVEVIYYLFVCRLRLHDQGTWATSILFSIAITNYYYLFLFSSQKPEKHEAASENKPSTFLCV